MIDKNGKLFGKISIVDILIIFAVIIAGLFLVNRLGLFSQKGQLQILEINLVLHSIKKRSIALQQTM